MRGVVGLVRWGYFDAARLEGWTVTRTGGDWTLAARVLVADRFKLSQQPLMFVVPHQKGAWHWPIERCDVTDGQLRARLGAPVD